MCTIYALQDHHANSTSRCAEAAWGTGDPNQLLELSVLQQTAAAIEAAKGTAVRPTAPSTPNRIITCRDTTKSKIINAKSLYTCVEITLQQLHQSDAFT